MTYSAEITWYDTRPHGDDVSYDQSFATLQEAVDFIQYAAKGRPCCRAWINNKEVRLRNGYVVDKDGEPFCTNQIWHDLFATPAEAFRPQPTRGAAPQNPATLGSIGKPV